MILFDTGTDGVDFRSLKSKAQGSYRKNHPETDGDSYCPMKVYTEYTGVLGWPYPYRVGRATKQPFDRPVCMRLGEETDALPSNTTASQQQPLSTHRARCTLYTAAI